MKKIVLSIVSMLLVFSCLYVLADEIVPYGNPDDTIDTPESLPYSSSFSFKNGSTTNAIERSSSTITVTLHDAYLTTNRSAKIAIKAYYWNGQTWISADSDSVTIDNTKADYSVKLNVSSGSVFYVRISKSDYPGYYAKGTLSIK